MKKLKIALFLGIGAGILDIIPMLFMQLSRFAVSAAFVHWIVAGIVITFVKVPLKGWLKGWIFSMLLVLSTIILVAQNTPGDILPMLVSSTILGMLIGWLSERGLKQKPANND